MSYLGDFPINSTVYIPFNTFNSNGASVTITGLTTNSIGIYKDGATTQRSSAVGYTLLDTDGIDFDGITGIHGFKVDLSDNSDAGFYAAGHEYMVVVSGITCDSQSLSFVAAEFSIERANAALALLKAGTVIVASVSGAVGSVSGSVGSVAGNVTGSVGSVAGNVTGSVGSVAGNVTGSVGSVAGNVTGSVASVAGNVVGSVGSVAGNVTGSVASVVGDVSGKVLGGGSGVLTGTGVRSDLWSILGTALTETAGQIAASFKKFFNVAAPTGTINDLPVSAPSAATIATQVDTTLSGTHGAGLWTSGSGSGTVIYSYTVTDSTSGLPIADVDVSVFTDVNLTNKVAELKTSVAGLATFQLDPGTYYFFCSKEGYQFTNPDTEVVS